MRDRRGKKIGGTRSLNLLSLGKTASGKSHLEKGGENRSKEETSAEGTRGKKATAKKIEPFRTRPKIKWVLVLEKIPAK